MSKAVTVPAEEVGTFDLNIDFANGESVVVTFTYPKDRAVLAINAVGRISELGTNLIYALRDDPSVRDKLDESGISFDDEEDDW